MTVGELIEELSKHSAELEVRRIEEDDEGWGYTEIKGVRLIAGHTDKIGFKLLPYVAIITE